MGSGCSRGVVRVRVNVPDGVNSAYAVPDDVIGAVGGEGGTWALNSVRDSVGHAPRGRDLG